MATFAAIVLIKTDADTFPVSQEVDIEQALFVEIKNEGVNAIDFEFVNSGQSGRIRRGDKIPFNSTSDTFTDSVEITFHAPAKVIVSWTDGIPQNGGGTGDATAANQQIQIDNQEEIIDLLEGNETSLFSGNVESTELVEVDIPGVQVTDVALSVTMLFDGEDGTLNGVVVPSGFIATYTGTFRNQVASINYTVPSTGGQRVIIAYTKI